MPRQDFYANLKPLTSFAQLTDQKHYSSVPEGWNLIITDIKGSTRAISRGKYKDVNTVGASSIIAVLNAVKKLEIPFVFGGDGATLLVPDEALPETTSALLATKQMAKEAFKLELRVGIVPITELTTHGIDLRVAKFMASPNYYQALFAGEGLTYAEHLVKEHPSYQLHSDVPSKADFSGLSCRWRDIQSPHGETVSLIVKATGTPARDKTIYRAVLALINKTYGSEADFHPITEDQLKLSVPGTEGDVALNGWRKTRFGRALYKIVWGGILFVTSSLMKSPITLADLNFRRYKRLLIASTDYRKFDGALRLVMAGTTKQREQLTKELDVLRKKGQLIYGLHVSDRALMTCIVFELYGKQVHFVDGADGGYARAAAAMKKQAA